MTDLTPINIPASRALVPGREKPHVTRDEVQQLLDATSNPKHRLLIRLLWATGCRVSEIVGDKIATPPFPGIRVRDFGKRSGSGYQVSIQRLKRKKLFLDTLLMPFDLGLAIEDYIRISGLHAGDKIIALDRRGAWAAISRMGKEVLGIRLHPHMFRHGFVYELVSHGASPYTVSALIGHANLSSAMAYYHPSEEELLRAREQVAL